VEIPAPTEQRKRSLTLCQALLVVDKLLHHPIEISHRVWDGTCRAKPPVELANSTASLETHPFRPLFAMSASAAMLPTPTAATCPMESC
jgi:hypothetical protein